MKGEKGDKGDDIKILGTYKTYEEFISAHPTGNVGDTYLVNGDLYIWNESTNIWENGGKLTGGGRDISELADLFFPIGRGFLDFTDTDYSNWLGLTWERELVGMTPIGKDENDTDFATVGATGGEKTHQLTLAELPKHRFQLSATVLRLGNKEVNGLGAGLYWSDVGIGTGATTDYKGGDQPHNNMPPYKVVSYWKRIA